MKLPINPPSFSDLLAKSSLDRLTELFLALDNAPLRKDYLHGDKLIHLTPPGGITHEEWWLFLKSQRRFLYKNIPLRNAKAEPFRFALVDPIPEQLHFVDQNAGGHIGVAAPVLNSQTGDQYSLSSLVEEAITSSQLEGAATTRKVAKEMLLTQRPPTNRSERMIVNNFQTMRLITEIKEEPLTPELVFYIHRTVTENTLNDATAAGRFRNAEEEIVVGTGEGIVYHVPPPASEMAGRMEVLCAFANGQTPDYFVHPVIRAIILHFWLAYDHPFVDGSGRTARALFYWAMLHHGDWLCEFISVSRILKMAKIKYERAFLYTETDDNDLTYFILYQLTVLHQAIDALHSHVKRKAAQQQESEQRLLGMRDFNSRQRVLLSHALRHPHFQYTIEGHKTIHNIVHQTARTDLLGLVERDLFTAQKSGRVWRFTPSPSLEKQLRQTA